MRDFIQLFLRCVEFFFILYMVGYASFLFLSVTVGSSTLYAAKRRNALKNELSNDYYVPVSVIVPAYNEEVTIEATIRSLLALDYRLYEIIVVDDGSSDRTSEQGFYVEPVEMQVDFLKTADAASWLERLAVRHIDRVRCLDEELRVLAQIGGEDA